MNKLLFKFFNYPLLIVSLVTFNEFTIVFLDKTPPLSDDTLYSIRKINFFMVLFFFYIKFFCLNVQLNYINKFLFNLIKKISFICFFVLLINLFLKFIGIGINKHWYDEQKIRFNTPYDMFSNEPNVLDHNEFGFRGPSLNVAIDKNTLSIAFLGGSTGYTGTPPIPEMLSKNLTDHGIKNIIYNFSVNSSNHNQHIHRLVKFIDHPYDIIIFYGGNNESIQYLQYETRPSYPYNYFMKNDLSVFKIFLLKYSSIFGMIENRTGIISGINLSRKYINNNFDIWSDEVVDNYISTINNAKLLFDKKLRTNRCKDSIFIPILQPVNPRTKKEVQVWNKIKESVKNNPVFIDYSNDYENIEFFDNVHVDQNSRVKIANLMKNDLLKIINNKCN